MSNGNAPVCPVSRDQAVPGMPMRQMPPIPRAQDLPSVISVLNQIAQLLNPPVNPGSILGTGSDANFTPGSSSDQDGGGIAGVKKKPKWRERNRIDDGVSIPNPDDPKIVVVIPRIRYLYFVEDVTTVNLKWQL